MIINRGLETLLEPAMPLVAQGTSQFRPGVSKGSAGVHDHPNLV